VDFRPVGSRAESEAGGGAAAFRPGRVCPCRSQNDGELIADETEKWGKVAKFAGIKAD
jgi:hypothetical protein